MHGDLGSTTPRSQSLFRDLQLGAAVEAKKNTQIPHPKPRADQACCEMASQLFEGFRVSGVRGVAGSGLAAPVEFRDSETWV